MIRRIGIGFGGAAIGGVLGWTIAAFTGWTPVVAIVAIVFAALAVFNDQRDRRPASNDSNHLTRLFPPDGN